MEREPVSQEALYQLYAPKVFGYLLQKTGNRQTAEDLCADVFVKIYANLERYDAEKSSLSTWIYTITRNTLYDFYRTNHPFSLLSGEEKTQEPDTLDRLCNAETLEALAAALAKLPKQQRDLILLHYSKKMTLKEIAQKSGYSYSYSKVIHQKALQNLKKFLEIS